MLTLMLLVPSIMWVAGLYLDQRQRKRLRQLKETSHHVQ